MAKVKIKLNSRGIAALLKSPEVARDLDRRAQAIQRAAGPGMESSTIIGRTRARASVITADARAMRAEARDRRLTSSIDAGR